MNSKMKITRFILGALVLALFGLATYAQTPAEIARQKKLQRQGKTPGAVPGAPGAPTAPTGAPATTPTGPAAKGAPANPARGAAGAPGSPAGARPGTATGAPGAAPAPAGGVLPGSTPPPQLGDIDQILEGEEEVLSGSGYSYDPGNRRDPFKSLLAAPDRQEFRGPRPDGIPGLLIDEIDLTGIYKTSRGYVAQVKAANQAKSYLLKEGDQLYDGDVVSISYKEVVFKQTVQDPTALKPFREVVKTLSP
jgi:hypothetical protein